MAKWRKKIFLFQVLAKKMCTYYFTTVDETTPSVDQKCKLAITAAMGKDLYSTKHGTLNTKEMNKSWLMSNDIIMAQCHGAIIMAVVATKMKKGRSFASSLNNARFSNVNVALYTKKKWPPWSAVASFHNKKRHVDDFRGLEYWDGNLAKT